MTEKLSDQPDTKRGGSKRVESKKSQGESGEKRLRSADGG